MGAGRTVDVAKSAQRTQREQQPRYFETRELELMAEPHRGARCLPLIRLTPSTVRAIDASMILGHDNGDGLNRSVSNTERDIREATAGVSH